MSTTGVALQPTFYGHVSTTQDALILFEACLQGRLSHVPRRLHDRERSSLIRSGCIFIYEENASGIKRWTDGVTWSPSRTLGNFLVYRELNKCFPPCGKKRTMKRQPRRSSPGEPYARPDAGSFSDCGSQSSPYGAERAATEVERQLIGSLIDSYGFKQDGLVKKAMSVTVQGETYRLVSYYNVNDVIQNNLQTPSQTDNLQYIRPRRELTSKQSFRSLTEGVGEVDAAPTADGYLVDHPHYIQDHHQQPYYIPLNYPSMNQQEPLRGAPYSLDVLFTSGSYIESLVPASRIHTPRNDYGQYDQSTYHRNYDSLNNSIPPIPTTIRSVVPDRCQIQLGMYPAMNMQRSVNNLSHTSIVSRSRVPHPANHDPVKPSHTAMDRSRQSPSFPGQAKYEDRWDVQLPTTNENLLSNQQLSHLYGSTPGYYPNSAGKSVGSSQYSQSGQLGQWQGTRTISSTRQYSG
ncbi:uncharacterized protein A1O9_13002 [Exophiala aquamarina CBS 119918]|uniref:Gti1/Pac2 family protein n=1 Tax=Exophiala aquamarina CBS 119918 TaxID=1182545 RepID=A0A072P5P6_9EURO|nr:uncharacterized protein A1O9_13002 [Exophiala aquamarina CBS 119918]KEF50940.1 hypothetical protein A1O9_13002 [Exophiala aquamarina CBS 119918]